MAKPELGTNAATKVLSEGAVAVMGSICSGATKAALISLCRSCNVEESPHGVTATAICPGYVDTDMSEWVHDTVPPCWQTVMAC